MRILLVFSLPLLLAFATACTDSGLAEPIVVPPQLPEATPLPTATQLPTPTALSEPSTPEPAPVLPTVTPLPEATPLPSATPLPTLEPLAEPTLLPTSEVASPAPVLPVPTSTPEQRQPIVAIEDQRWPVELAVTPEERNQGLSGRESLPELTGMLFVFESDQHLSFWMVDMNFPLDMVWIDSSCRVVDVTLDAPIPLPDQSRGELPRFRPSSPAKFVLEINAGEFMGAQLEIGDVVEFEQALAGKYGC